MGDPEAGTIRRELTPSQARSRLTRTLAPEGKSSGKGDRFIFRVRGK